MTIYIRPMSEFPYEVNSRDKAYFDRNKQPIPASVMRGHYCIAYEGKDYALASWSHKQSKGLTNIATFFEGSTTDEKRQLLWSQVQARTLPKPLTRFLDRYSKDSDLYLWYLSEHDRPTAELIKRFIDWYANQ